MTDRLHFYWTRLRADVARLLGHDLRVDAVPTRCIRCGSPDIEVDESAKRHIDTGRMAYRVSHTGCPPTVVVLGRPHPTHVADEAEMRRVIEKALK